MLFCFIINTIIRYHVPLCHILSKLVNKDLIYSTNLSQHRNSLNLIILNCYIQGKLTVSLD